MRTGLRRPWSAAVVAMAALCVFNFVMAPHFECLMEGNCDDVDSSLLPSIYARSVSVTCLVTAAVSLFRYRGAVAAYRGLVELCDSYAPATDGAAAAAAFGHAAFRGVVTGTCAALILPVNGYRLYRFVSDGRQLAVIVYFALMYSQNVAVCLFETHFVAMFYALYTRFADVNREMTAAAEAAGPPLADAVERLRVRHRLVREAVDALRPAFALPVGLSLCNLCVMALFDVYYHLKNTFVQQTGDRTNVYICLWLAQYMFRFFVITMTVDATTKQALRSKETITDVSRYCLDVGTKEELQIFLNQISSTTMEFTMCDLFTVNGRLFTSAMGVCITYLVILLQFKIKTDNIY